MTKSKAAMILALAAIAGVRVQVMTADDSDSFNGVVYEEAVFNELALAPAECLCVCAKLPHISQAQPDYRPKGLLILFTEKVERWCKVWKTEWG